MANYSSRPCRCGSGETHYPLIDAAGIFCTYVCETCEPDKRKSYNPAIFEQRTYAMTGDESDLDSDPDLDRW